MFAALKRFLWWWFAQINDDSEDEVDEVEVGEDGSEDGDGRNYELERKILQSQNDSETDPQRASFSGDNADEIEAQHTPKSPAGYQRYKIKTEFPSEPTSLEGTSSDGDKSLILGAVSLPSKISKTLDAAESCRVNMLVLERASTSKVETESVGVQVEIEACRRCEISYRKGCCCSGGKKCKRIDYPHKQGNSSGTSHYSVDRKSISESSKYERSYHGMNDLGGSSTSSEGDDGRSDPKYQESTPKRTSNNKRDVQGGCRSGGKKGKRIDYPHKQGNSSGTSHYSVDRKSKNESSKYEQSYHGMNDLGGPSTSSNGDDGRSVPEYQEPTPKRTSNNERDVQGGCRSGGKKGKRIDYPHKQGNSSGTSHYSVDRKSKNESSKYEQSYHGMNDLGGPSTSSNGDDGRSVPEYQEPTPKRTSNNERDVQKGCRSGGKKGKRIDYPHKQGNSSGTSHYSVDRKSISESSKYERSYHGMNDLGGSSTSSEGDDGRSDPKYQECTPKRTSNNERDVQGGCRSGGKKGKGIDYPHKQGNSSGTSHYSVDRKSKNESSKYERSYHGMNDLGGSSTSSEGDDGRSDPKYQESTPKRTSNNERDVQGGCRSGGKKGKRIDYPHKQGNSSGTSHYSVDRKSKNESSKYEQSYHGMNDLGGPSTSSNGDDGRSVPEYQDSTPKRTSNNERDVQEEKFIGKSSLRKYVMEKTPKKHNLDETDKSYQRSSPRSSVKRGFPCCDESPEPKKSRVSKLEKNK